MSGYTSIHFSKTTSFSLFHNDRSKTPSYVIRNDKNNEVDKSAQEATITLSNLYTQAKKNYTSTTRQKFQAKNYLIEAVIVIEDRHTIEDIKAIADMVEEKTGYRPIQLSIHRDEGKDLENINHHSHIVFFTLDNNGKSLQRKNFNNKALMSDIQTSTAEILQMRRGVSKEITKAEYLNHRQYKSAINAAKRHIKQELDKFHNKLRQRVINAIESTTNAVKKFFMTEQIENLELENIELKKESNKLQKEIESQEFKLETINQEARHYKELLVKEKSKHIEIDTSRPATINPQQHKQTRKLTLS